MTHPICTVCGNRSISGLKPGHGKCRWHWDAGVWGRRWALQLHGPEPAAIRSKPERTATN